MNLKSELKRLFWRIRYFMKGYRMCRCRDLVPKKEMKGGLCAICQRIYSELEGEFKEKFKEKTRRSKK